MKLVVIGAVAAGTSAAAIARRNREDMEITIYEKDRFISYSGCGMPYFLGGEIQDIKALLPRDPAYFKNKHNIDILTLHEVLAIHPENKTLEVINLVTEEIFIDSYDKLVIATGARPNVPPIKGLDSDNVFFLRNINDMEKIHNYIIEKKVKNAVIIGTGLIGLETADNLCLRDIKITLVEKMPHIFPAIDGDMAKYIEKALLENDIHFITGQAVEEIRAGDVILSDGTILPTDMVVVSAGVHPETKIAAAAGIELGTTGAIKVNKKMQTNIPDIYACGDCIEQYHLITKKPVFYPMGSTANKTGRIAGDNLSGGNVEFRGVLGTSIMQLFDMTIAQTGLTEKEALQQGYDITIIHNKKTNKPLYMGGREMMIKAIADNKDGRVLGVQIVGYEGVDKRIDVFVTAITFGTLAEDLFHLDLAYSPAYSNAKDPVMYTGMVLENAMIKSRPLITPEELENIQQSKEDHILIDARETDEFAAKHIDSSHSIPLPHLREVCEELNKDRTTIVYCNKGITANAAQNLLLNKGFEKVFNLSGGHEHYCICIPELNSSRK
ncbi:MAG: FAD-dependent oxidoreductase [Syntrophomonadaceae bacterium]|nr:FAD-dependent oxidoreductase [Syntrophomonadaceae bacterium]